MNPKAITHLFLWSCLLPVMAMADSLTGKVVKIADGDRIHVLAADNTEHMIRLAGIDAPETGQHFGRQSRQHLAGLIEAETVSIDYGKQDKYGELLGHIYHDRHGDVNLAMLQGGFAWLYPEHTGELSPAKRELYADTEGKAKSQKLGLWTQIDPVAPWIWREQKRNEAEQARQLRQKAFEHQRRQMARQRAILEKRRADLAGLRARQRAQNESRRQSTSYYSYPDARVQLPDQRSPYPQYVPSVGKLCRKQNGVVSCW